MSISVNPASRRVGQNTSMWSQVLRGVAAQVDVQRAVRPMEQRRFRAAPASGCNTTAG